MVTLFTTVFGYLFLGLVGFLAFLIFKIVRNK